MNMTFWLCKMYQVFGPNDAVDFVQKLLNVRSCFIFSYLPTWKEVYNCYDTNER